MIVVFAIYADSFLFVLATAILQFGFGVGYSGAVCESAILLCLTCYVTTKVRSTSQLRSERYYERGNTDMLCLQIVRTNTP